MCVYIYIYIHIHSSASQGQLRGRRDGGPGEGQLADSVAIS